MKREQSRAGSRFAECEKSRLKAKILITLALLLTAVTGAWAQDIATPVISGETEFYDEVTVSITCASSGVDIYYTLDGSDPKDDGNKEQKEFKGPFTLTETTTVRAAAYSGDAWSTIAEVTFTKLTGPTWDAATKTGTFSMPGSDVVLTPIYAKAAAFATTGTEPEVKTLLPEAAEGVIAGTTAPLIVEGTVAFAGTTENPQGLVMYYAAKGTADAAPTAPTLESLWSADVPTAEAYINDEDGATVYVWYYIAGANTPDGEDPTADNTFNDSEICAVPLKVTVLSNKFDLALKAANANTIEAGKATVTVGGTAATVTDGKLQGVKMGSEVKVKANTGYKFRKVEAKKKEATLQTVNIGGDTSATLYYLPGETFGQAIANHPENSSFEIKGGYITCNGLWLCIGYYDGDVTPDTLVEANGDYRGLLA